MTRRYFLLAAPLALVAALGAWAWTQSISATVLDLPTRLSDREFWRLSETLSEPNGYFRSENLVSNEDTFQYVIPPLASVVEPGGVYLGVGPDQNFTYIAAVKPRMAFITDIRRGNLLMHLMYKALFEQSADRAAFLSRLFSRPRPDGLDASSSPESLFAAYATIRPDKAAFDNGLKAILRTLVEDHGFALSEQDVAGIEHVYGNFYVSGPYLAYSTRIGGGGSGRYPTYQDLQMSTDLSGVNHSYMASEAHYAFVRNMQQRNMIVPVVGNFAGPKALRATGEYLRARGARVTTFYTSNVEQYLFQDRLWGDFADNVMTMPIDETSTFIRSCFNTCASPYRSRSVSQLDSIAGLMRDYAAGRITSYWAVLNHTR
jgi:hypothetical protein